MKKSTFKFEPYPEPDKIEVGCKVSWNYYRDKTKAEACAKAAEHNREYCLSLGYDFGYCWPGTIDPPKDGLYRVCLP